MLYRYEIDSKETLPHTGILCGLDDLFEEYSDEILCAVFYFEAHLECPECFSNNNNHLVCWFTSNGNRKFKKYIKVINDEFHKIGVNIIRLEIDEKTIDTIYYKDKYQVVIDQYYSDIAKSIII